MAQNFSQLAILEGNENCIPIHMNGRTINVPERFFYTELNPIEEVIDHADKNLLNGISDHFRKEGLLVGDDGFIYASINPDDQTLSGDDYEPIALLDGDDLDLAGFKFRFKMPGKKKKSKALIKTKSKFLNKVGSLATKGYRNFTLPGAFGKKGIIGRNLKALKNPFKRGKGGGGFMDALQQIQEAQAAQAESMQQPTLEEPQTDSSEYVDESQTDSSYEEPQTDSSEYVDESQTDSSYEEPQTDSSYSEEDMQEPQGLGSVRDRAFSTAQSAISLLPGGGLVNQGLSLAKGFSDEYNAERKAKKAQKNQARIELLRTMIANNPSKPVVVRKAPPAVKKKTVAPMPNRIAPQQQLSVREPMPEFKSSTRDTDAQPKDNKGMLIAAGIAAVVIGAIAMSGKEKE
jgi:hypothetical protein